MNLHILKINLIHIFCTVLCLVLLCHAQLFSTPWTTARKTPLSMRILQARILEWVAMSFSRGFSQPRDWNQAPGLQADSLLSDHKGGPRILEWEPYPFSRGSSQPRNWTRVSCIAGRFFNSLATREVLTFSSDSYIETEYFK